MPIALPCTILHTASLTKYNLFLNGQFTREREWILTAYSAKIAIKDANSMRGICA